MKKKCSLDPSNNRIVGNTNILINIDSIGLFTKLRVVVIVVQNVYVDRSSEKRENVIFPLLYLFLGISF